MVRSASTDCVLLADVDVESDSEERLLFEKAGKVTVEVRKKGVKSIVTR